MTYSKDEVVQYINEEDVKFIRLAFCDAYGNQKNISIMPGEVERAFEYGIGIDASAVEGFGGDVYSDLLLFPDPSTLVVLPWRPDSGRVVRMFCDIKYPDLKCFEADQRKILKDAVKAAADKGYLFSFGSELEFYLFKTDQEGNPTKIPFDNAGYMDIAPMDKGENVRREICLTLERMGIRPETSHHEEGPGQNEIDFKFSDPLTAADNAITFISVVRTIAARNGLYADFMPKPIKEHPGNGFHINISVRSIHGEKDLPPYVVEGIVRRISEITAFLNPVEDSYERLGHCKAPEYITWSSQNRSELIRIPAAEGEYKRIELRSPDPAANPYIAYALIIHAALEGIEKKELPPVAANVNLFSLNDDESRKYEKLPMTLKEARTFAEKSEFVKSALPDAVREAYLKG